MSAPTEPQPVTGNTNPPSARSDVDETVPAASNVPAAHGFGPPAAPGEVGTLGPYRLVKELGKGGMGAVYATLDTRLDRKLALKVMLPAFAADDAAKERFLREAKAAARIKHDNVVTVYEADERNGVPYIAMEFLDGLPLDQFLKQKGSPTIPQILRIGAEAASGLKAAHDIGLVHRDIKPGNLWLEAPHGRVKVLDFGLAKPVDAEVELTKSGAVVGTPAYMSPEQARAEKVDYRTDLFSLGSVLYRLCTGKLPFSGATTMAVLMALGTEEPRPVRELNPAVSESLAALIHQLLAKRAGARPQNAAEVVRRLRSIVEELAAPRAPERSTSQPQVVYVPIQVTAAPPEQNPFADLDASVTEVESAEPDESSATTPTPARERPGPRWLWPAVGFAVLLAVVGGVIIVIKNKDGTETKIEVPDGATVTVKDKDGKTLAQVGPGGKQSAADADRTVAEWVIAQGGLVRVNGESKDIGAAADLFKKPFTLDFVKLNGARVTDAGLENLKRLRGLTFLSLDQSRVSDAGMRHIGDCESLTQLELQDTQVSDQGLEYLKKLKNLRALDLRKTRVSDEGLKHLKEVTNLETLFLGGTRVSGEGLKHLKELKKLTRIDLGSTPMSDEGLKHLKELKSLTTLHLDGTKVSDEELKHLKELKNLTYLDLKQTKVTTKGLEEFHAALPACKIEHDGGVIEAVDVDRTAAEWVIAQGGAVGIDSGGRIEAIADLPKGRFALISVNLDGNKQATDLGLAHLRGLKNLKDLNLDRTPVTDAGLAHLKEVKSLTVVHLSVVPVTDAGLAHLKEVKGLTALYLSETKITDAGLEHFKECKELAVVHLAGTAVTDVGLEHLREIKGLTQLDVRGTKVTAKGLATLHAALPACKIVHDGGIIEPKK